MGFIMKITHIGSIRHLDFQRHLPEIAFSIERILERKKIQGVSSLLIKNTASDSGILLHIKTLKILPGKKAPIVEIFKVSRWQYPKKIAGAFGTESEDFLTNFNHSGFSSS
jgi:hypothetical protein